MQKDWWGKPSSSPISSFLHLPLGRMGGMGTMVISDLRTIEKDQKRLESIPHWPTSLAPKVYATPLFPRTTLWLAPAAMSTALTPSGSTTGITMSLDSPSSSSKSLPSPRWPSLPQPKEKTCPAKVWTSVWQYPPSTRLTGSPVRSSRSSGPRCQLSLRVLRSGQFYTMD